MPSTVGRGFAARACATASWANCIVVPSSRTAACMRRGTTVCSTSPGTVMPATAATSASADAIMGASAGVR